MKEKEKICSLGRSIIKHYEAFNSKIIQKYPLITNAYNSLDPLLSFSFNQTLKSVTSSIIFSFLYCLDSYFHFGEDYKSYSGPLSLLENLNDQIRILENELTTCIKKPLLISKIIESYKFFNESYYQTQSKLIEKEFYNELYKIKREESRIRAKIKTQLISEDLSQRIKIEKIAKRKLQIRV